MFGGMRLVDENIAGKGPSQNEKGIYPAAKLGGGQTTRCCGGKQGTINAATGGTTAGAQ